MNCFFYFFIFLTNLNIFVCQNNSSETTTTTTAIISTQTTPKTTTSQLKQSTLPSSTTTSTQLLLKVGILGANSSELRSAYGFGQSVPAISIALQRARNEHLVDFVNFTFTWLICDCDQVFAVGYSNKLILDQNVDVIIGPPCVTSAVEAGLPPGFYNIPIFLWGATIATVFNDNDIYPSLTNINSNTKFLAQAVEAVLMQYGWYDFSFIYIPDNIRS
uniref:Receptor ligand binding region domain-containing protein n=1 Tax=Meloidogyne incognita TaxID=6306 RepID=A0A914NIX6_MELIC